MHFNLVYFQAEVSTVEDEQRLVEAEPEAVAALLDGEAAGAEDIMEIES